MFSWVCETSAANPARVWVWKLGGNVSSDLFVCVDTKARRRLARCSAPPFAAELPLINPP